MIIEYTSGVYDQAQRYYGTGAVFTYSGGLTSDQAGGQRTLFHGQANKIWTAA